MPKLTDPTLKAQRVELGKSKRRGDITERVFKNRVKKLEEKQLELNEAEYDRRYKLYQERKRAEAKAKRDFKKQKKIVLGNVIFDKTFNKGTTEEFVYNIWENVSGYNDMKVYIRNEFGNDKKVFDIAYVAKYKQFRNQFLHGSDEWYFTIRDRIIIFKNTDLDSEKLHQYFKDGISHCVFSPIKQKILENINTTKSKDAMKKWRVRYNNIVDLEKKYELGVPEDKMIDVAITSGFKIIIKDIIGNDLFLYNEKSKSGSLIFTNTRANHIDEGFLTLQDKGIELSSSEMSKKWNEIKNDFYMVEGDLKKGLPRKLMTLDGVWSLNNPEKEYFDEMNRIASISDCRFNASKYPDVNEFIKSGRIINSWNLNLGNDATGHIDMKKAYTQFKQCSFYKGFLGVIHQWRCGSFNLDFIKNHIGIYRFKIIEFDNQLLSKLGFVFGGTYTLPSVEIEYFISLGMIVEIDAGVFGASIDFEFTEDMLLKGEDGVPRYSRWSGTLGSENLNKNYTFKCDKKWASHLKHELSADNVFYWENLGVCSVKLPIDNVYTTHHILAFITSYVRIQMIQTMMKFDINNLVRVVMDGIYYKGDLPEVGDLFIAKKIKENGSFSDYWYSPSTVEVVWDSDTYSKNTLLTGAGGNGKTYKVLNDKGLNRVLFVAPMNLLGKGVASQYKIRSTTIHKLLGKDCIPWIKEQAYPPVILIDETTQIQADWIDEVFKMYPKSLILLAGDIDSKGQWFQCRNGNGIDFSKVWKPHDVDIISMDIDRRSLDDELRELKIKIRNKMKEVFVDGDNYNECIKMTMWANKLNTISFDDAVKQFSVGDAWIAGTHAINVKLLENGVVSGWYKKGGNISYEEKENFEKRGSFTTHSFQGQTIEDKKVFISINSCFEYSMLYTAISRVRRISQLVFVR